MEERIDWAKVNPQAYAGILAVSRSTVSLEPKLSHLVATRVSQINGCGYCLEMHTRDARDAGETQYRLDCLAGWRDVPAFTERERAALAWAEAITRIADTHASDVLYEALQAHFNEREIVDLTMTIVAINAWNRTQISMRRFPQER